MRVHCYSCSTAYRADDHCSRRQEKEGKPAHSPRPAKRFRRVLSSSRGEPCSGSQLKYVLASCSHFFTRLCFDVLRRSRSIFEECVPQVARGTLETSQEASNMPVCIHDHATGERFNVSPIPPCQHVLLNPYLQHHPISFDITLGPNRIIHVVLHYTRRLCPFVAASHTPSREAHAHPRRRRGSVTTVSLAERGEEYVGDHVWRRF